MPSPGRGFVGSSFEWRGSLLERDRHTAGSPTGGDILFQFVPGAAFSKYFEGGIPFLAISECGEEVVDGSAVPIAIHVEKVSRDEESETVVEISPGGEGSVILEHVGSEVRSIDFVAKTAPSPTVAPVLGGIVADCVEGLFDVERSGPVGGDGDVFGEAFAEPAASTASVVVVVGELVAEFVGEGFIAGFVIDGVRRAQFFHTEGGEGNHDDILATHVNTGGAWRSAVSGVGSLRFEEEDAVAVFGAGDVGFLGADGEDAVVFAGRLEEDGEAFDEMALQGNIADEFVVGAVVDVLSCRSEVGCVHDFKIIWCGNQSRPTIGEIVRDVLGGLFEFVLAPLVGVHFCQGGSFLFLFGEPGPDEDLIRGGELGDGDDQWLLQFGGGEGGGIGRDSLEFGLEGGTFLAGPGPGVDGGGEEEEGEEEAHGERDVDDGAAAGGRLVEIPDNNEAGEEISGD